MSRPWRILVAVAGLIAAVTTVAVPALIIRADRAPDCPGAWTALCAYEADEP